LCFTLASVQRLFFSRRGLDKSFERRHTHASQQLGFPQDFGFFFLPRLLFSPSLTFSSPHFFPLLNGLPANLEMSGLLFQLVPLSAMSKGCLQRRSPHVIIHCLSRCFLLDPPPSFVPTECALYAKASPLTQLPVRTMVAPQVQEGMFLGSSYVKGRQIPQPR